MKKALTQITLMFLGTLIAFPALAQNNKLTKANRSALTSYASARIPGKFNPAVQKNLGTALSPAALSGLYVEDFEGAIFPPADWQAIDILDNSVVWTQSSDNPYSGLNCAFISYSPQTIDGEDWLILPKFTVAATDSFSFWLAVDFTLFPPDSTIIMVSTTDSLTTSFTDVVGTLAEGLNYPTTGLVYQYYSFELSSYAGQDIFVAFKNKNTYGDGVRIDKVRIGTKPPVNAASVSIDVPKFAAFGTTSPSATFLNDGNSTQSFPVTMTITGGYTSTKNITNLAAGTAQQITFDPWTTIGPSTETISIQSQLTGDLFAPDDTMTASVLLLEPFTNYGWVSKAPMSISRFAAASAAVNSNDTSYLFSMGGITTGFALSSDAGQYFPYSNSWAMVAAMNAGEFSASAASHGNNIYVIGGFLPGFIVVPDNQIYNIATNIWSNGIPMPIPVGDYALGIYHDSLFYYLGGYAGLALGDQDIVQIYNPATDTWTTGTNMPAAAEGIRGAIMGNKIIVTTGNNAGTALSSTYIGDIDPLNPTNITWSQWDDYPAGNNFRSGAGASLDEASGLVVFTGGDPDASGTGLLNATFAYDFNSNSWKIGPPKITSVNNLCNLTPIVDNDSLWMAAVGGYDGVNILDVNEWLNLGPYTIPTGINTIDISNVRFTCYPNPFMKFTDIKFSLARNSNVKAVIVDVLGSVVQELCNKNMNAGNHQLKWNAAGYSKGVYLCKLFVNDKEITQKLLKY